MGKKDTLRETTEQRSLPEKNASTIIKGKQARPSTGGAYGRKVNSMKNIKSI